MATEKTRSKGRFLYLFDWNAKSRKKLFSSRGDGSEEFNQGKECVDDLSNPHYLLELHENKDHQSFRGSCNYSSVSPINHDDGYGTKAPGVVARLMGLDSMPTMASCEASSLSSYDSLAASNSYYTRGDAPFPLEHHMVDYNYMPMKAPPAPWSSVNLRANKAHGRPIERFQTEVLPPKSAKSISITHHKLLSPIKSPGFIPTKDAAYVMEAAARILDPSPRPTSKVKVPSLGSPSSYSFKIQNVKDRIDAAQRSSRLPDSSKTPKHSTPVKQMRTSSSDKVSHRSLFKNILDSETSSSQKVKNKGKSVSVPVEDKANLQKRNGSVYSENRSQLQKEHKHVKLKQKQSNMQKVEQTRTSRSKTSGVLKQNNDKQNSASYKDRLTSKISIPDRQLRKVVSGDNSSSPSKVVNKVYVNSENRSKKMVTETAVNDRRTPSNGVAEKRSSSSSRMKNLSRDKQFHARGQLSENVPDKGDRRALQSDPSLQGDCKDMDIISFTFTSPIKKPTSQSVSSLEDNGRNHRCVGADSCGVNDQFHMGSSSPPSSGLSLVDSGSLSLLLEQKLKELTDKIVSTKFESGKEGYDTDSVSCCSESISSHDVPGTSGISYDDWFDKDSRSRAFDDDCSSPLVTKQGQKLKATESNVGHCISSSDKSEGRGSNFARLNVSSECSVSGSCISSNTTSDITYGNDQEAISCISIESIHPKEVVPEYTNEASYWEREYIRHVLHYAGLKTFGFAKDCKVIDPCIFDVLENLINTTGRNEELCCKSDRRLLFDCVTDIVSSIYERVFVGSHKAYAKWRLLLQNDWLSEEVYREIQYLQSMGSLMVDDLIEKEMSCPYGKWVDFELESLEEGMQIETQIISSLVDELVYDSIFIAHV